jgi:hypothetical protein
MTVSGPTAAKQRYSKGGIIIQIVGDTSSLLVFVLPFDVKNSQKFSRLQELVSKMPNNIGKKCDNCKNIAIFASRFN